MEYLLLLFSLIVGSILVAIGVNGLNKSWKEFEQYIWSKQSNPNWGTPPGIIWKWISIIVLGLILIGLYFTEKITQ